MPASTQIADDDVHNHPGITQISDDDVHNLPTQSADPDDPTPLVSTTQIDPEDVPEFEQPAAAQEQLTTGSEPGSVAHVDPDAPNKLAVDTPNRYTSAVQAHELTHSIQNAAGADNDVNTSGKFSSQADIDKIYGYNGTEGLAKVMASPKGISSLNKEQQASIPQTYMKEYNKAVKAGDAKAIDRLNEVYQPAIKQLRNMANPSKTTIDTTPDAPAGAPAELLGSSKPVKGMASNSTKSAVLPTQPAPVKAVKKPSWNAAAASALGRK